MNQRFPQSAAVFALLAALFAAPVHAQVCPFENSGASLANEGLVLTRYALGLRNAALMANTAFAAADAPTIACPSCGLNVTSNGTGTFTVADATTISRKIAGYSGAALTNGLGLSSPTVTAVNSFLLSGCGAVNAFVQGGNAFGAPAVIGTTDGQPVTVRSDGDGVRGINLLANVQNDGLRIVPQLAVDPTSRAPNVINGIGDNNFNAGVVGATIAGGGLVSLSPATEISANLVTGDHGSVIGGYGNTARLLAPVAGGSSNTASGASATVAGGDNNTADGGNSFAAGRGTKANHGGAFVWGDNTVADVTSTAVNQFVIRANGGIRLPGAGENQPGNAAKQSGTNMFTHVVPASGPCVPSGVGSAPTGIDHPLTNGKPNAILVVTNLSSLSGGASACMQPVGVYYEPTGNPGGCTPDRWVIFSLGSTPAMTVG